MWQHVRAWFFRNALNKAVPRQPFRQMMHWHEVQHVGVLIDIDSPSLVHAAHQAVAAMKKMGKQVRVLEWSRQKDFPQLGTISSWRLSAKDVNWYGKPSRGVIDDFTHSPFDVLLVFVEKIELPIRWVIAMSRASCRVGIDEAATDCFDLIVQVPAEAQNTSSFFDTVKKLMSLKGEPLTA